MHVEEIRNYCLEKEGVEESFPFGESTLVFKVKGKIFLLLSLDAVPLSFNVKCDPDQALQYREEYPDHVLPGYHMNKKHWNTIFPGGHLPNTMVKKMIDHSFDLVKGRDKVLKIKSK